MTYNENNNIETLVYEDFIIFKYKNANLSNPHGVQAK